MEALIGVQIQQFTSWSYIMKHSLFSWSQMVESLRSTVSVCVRVRRREYEDDCVSVCVSLHLLRSFLETELLFFHLMLDRWKAKNQYWPYMTIFSSHFSLPSPSPSLFFPTLIFDLHYIKSFKHIPYFGFSNLLRRLVYVTYCVSVWVKYVWSLMDECIELALVKNTERWVSLPRIQIGNFGDLRNAPTWNMHTQKKECVTNECLFSVTFNCLKYTFFLRYIWKKNESIWATCNISGSSTNSMQWNQCQSFNIFSLALFLISHLFIWRVASNPAMTWFLYKNNKQRMHAQTPAYLTRADLLNHSQQPSSYFGNNQLAISSLQLLTLPIYRVHVSTPAFSSLFMMAMINK